MRIFILILMFSLFLCACSEEVDEKRYEPIYVNTTEFDIAYVWVNSYNLSDTIIIQSMDSGYTTNEFLMKEFPQLHKEGLRWSPDSPIYDVYLIFHSDTLKCLNFIGDDFLPKDIRLFSSYENIGECDFCTIRAMSSPDGMLYTITEDLYKLATPCEKENSKKMMQ